MRFKGDSHSSAQSVFRFQCELPWKSPLNDPKAISRKLSREWHRYEKPPCEQEVLHTFRPQRYNEVTLDSHNRNWRPISRHPAPGPRINCLEQFSVALGKYRFFFDLFNEGFFTSFLQQSKFFLSRSTPPYCSIFKAKQKFPYDSFRFYINNPKSLESTHLF